MRQPLLTVHDLNVVFHMPKGDAYVLRSINLEVEHGEIFGLVGESGCGKTMTGLSILGLIPSPGEITEGQIIFDGVDLLNVSDREKRQMRGKRIAMIFQDPSAALNPVFTIGQQIMQVIRHHRVATRKGIRLKTISLLRDVELPNPEGILNTYPHQLSGGMQQRCVIAMALSSNPELLIADEPTTALDVTIQSQILDLLLRLQTNRDFTIILITHDMSIVSETCHKVAVLYAGQVVESGETSRVIRQPRHPYTQALLATLPHPGTRGQTLKVIPGAVPSALSHIAGCAFASRCAHAMDVCRVEEPPFVNHDGDHGTACYLYDSGQIEAV